MAINLNDIQLPTEGTGPSTATLTKVESTVTKHLSRVVIEHPDDGQACYLKPLSNGNMPVDGYNQLYSISVKPSGIDTMKYKSADFTASQTNQTLWDPGANRFVITGIIISFSAAGSITVYDGTDSTTYRVCKVFGGVNGGMVTNYTMGLRSSAVSNILKYATGTGAAGSITVVGYEV